MRFDITCIVLSSVHITGSFWNLRTIDEIPYVQRHVVADRSALPKLSDTDMIELYHLRSFPRLGITSQAGSFSVQTSGIALRSTDTTALVVLEFEPMNYSACFLPVIGPNSTLLWDHRSVISYMTELDITYWQQSTFLARINGVVYANYVKWIEEYLKKHSTFIPASICSGSDALSCFTGAQTWDNFVADSLEAFAELAVQMHAILPPRASEIQILSGSEPELFEALTDIPNTDSHVTNFDPVTSNAGHDDSIDPNFSFSPEYSDGSPVERTRVNALTGPSLGEEKKSINLRVAQHTSSVLPKGTIVEPSGHLPGKANRASELLKKKGSFTSSPVAAESHSKSILSVSPSSLIHVDSPTVLSVSLSSLSADSANPVSVSPASDTIPTPTAPPTPLPTALEMIEIPQDPSAASSSSVGRDGDIKYVFDENMPPKSGPEIVTPDINDNDTHQSGEEGDKKSGEGSEAGVAAPGAGDGEGEGAVAQSAPISEQILEPSTTSPPPTTATTNGTTVVTTAGHGNGTGVIPPAASNATVWTAEIPMVEPPATVRLKNVTNTDVVQYYVALMGCMQGYQLETYSSALRSCMSEAQTFIHYKGNTYYSTRPRYPFVFIHDYLQAIPSAVLTTDSGTGLGDLIIGSVLLFAGVVGCIASLWKLKLCEWSGTGPRNIRRRRLSSAAPVEGGYSESSELPVYRMWVGLWGSTTSAQSPRLHDESEEQLLSHPSRPSDGSLFTAGDVELTGTTVGERAEFRGQQVRANGLFSCDDLTLHGYNSLESLSSLGGSQGGLGMGGEIGSDGSESPPMLFDQDSGLGVLRARSREDGLVGRGGVDRWVGRDGWVEPDREKRHRHHRGGAGGASAHHRGGVGGMGGYGRVGGITGTVTASSGRTVVEGTAVEGSNNDDNDHSYLTHGSIVTTRNRSHSNPSAAVFADRELDVVNDVPVIRSHSHDEHEDKSGCYTSAHVHGRHSRLDGPVPPTVIVAGRKPGNIASSNSFGTDDLDAGLGGGFDSGSYAYGKDAIGRAGASLSTRAGSGDTMDRIPPHGDAVSDGRSPSYSSIINMSYYEDDVDGLPIIDDNSTSLHRGDSTEFSTRSAVVSGATTAGSDGYYRAARVRGSDDRTAERALTASGYSRSPTTYKPISAYAD